MKVDQTLTISANPVNQVETFTVKPLVAPPPPPKIAVLPIALGLIVSAALIWKGMKP